MAGQNEPVSCTRCQQRNIKCLQVSISQNRFYPRPTRTGRRIELGRQLHGSAIYAEEESDPQAAANGHLSSMDLTWPRIYLRLIHCYFSYPFTTAPVVEYERFAQAFNRSFGDPVLMARYLNGQEGDEATRSYFTERQTYLVRNDTSIKDEWSPETVEVLLTTICAWGAHHIFLPFESLDVEIFANMGNRSLVEVADSDHELGFRRAALVGTPTSVSDPPPPQKRQKRRQGVACDTCRLRRVRCDLMEQPPGVKACSRCRVKRIVCTDRYIQWKRERDLLKNPQAARALPDVQLLPLREEFHLMEELPPSIRSLSQQEILEFGNTREAACNYLINRVLALFHKYNLVNKCTTQGVYAMIMLASILDYTRATMASSVQRVAMTHLSHLYKRGEFDLSLLMRESSLADLFARLSAMRALQAGWVRDAVFNVMYQKKPILPSSWFIVGYRTGPGGEMEPAPVTDLMQLTDTLDPPQSLGLIFLLTQQVGVVAHEVYNKILQPTLEDTKVPTLEYVSKLRAACQYVWDSLYSIEASLHVLVAKARPLLNSALPLNPLKWTWMVFCLSFMIYRAVSRRLSEWMASARNAVLQAHIVSEDESMELLGQIRSLVQVSMERTLCLGRVMAHYSRNLLPTYTLLRGSNVARLLFRVAQLLSHSDPLVDDVGTSFEPDTLAMAKPTSLLTELLNPDAEDSEGSPSLSPHIPPAASPSDVDLLLSVPLSTALEPFTRQAKQAEVSWCIEALGQLGFSHAGMAQEIRRVVEILQANE